MKDLLSVCELGGELNHSSPSLQDTQWGLQGSRSGAALGTACLECLSATRKAYPWKSWEQVTSECAVSAVFKAEVAGVLETFKSKKQDFLLQEYVQEECTQYESYRTMTFLTEKAWKEQVPGLVLRTCLWRWCAYATKGAVLSQEFSWQTIRLP